MRFFISYKESPFPRFLKRNSKLTLVVVFVFLTCILFGVPRQIANAQTVHIPDPGLRAALELALDKKAGEDITQADMAGLQSLQASRCRFLGLSKTGPRSANRWICQPADGTFGSGIRDLTGLEFAINLTTLHLGRNKISDVSPLKNLIKLTYLDLGSNWRISDVSLLKDLTNLTHLYLRGNPVSDLSPLTGLTNLIELDLNVNQVPDVSPLKDLTNLIYLDLGHNQLSDVSPLKDLINLTVLNLRDNEITDVSLLKDLTNLTHLYLRGNQVSDVSPSRI